MGKKLSKTIPTLAKITLFTMGMTMAASGRAFSATFTPVHAKPECVQGAANFTPFLTPRQTWNIELVPAGNEAPQLWLERSGDQLRAGFHSAAHITYWTCPPDGDSAEATLHSPFVAIYTSISSVSTGVSAFSRIGYTPIDLYHPTPIKLEPTVDVIDDLNDYFDDIDGSGAELEYRGPGETLRLGIPADFDPETNEFVTVSFPDACGPGMPLEVKYRKLSSIQ